MTEATLVYPWTHRGPDYYGQLKITHKLLDLAHGGDGLKLAVMRNPYNSKFDRWLRYAGLLSMATKDAPVLDLARGVKVRETKPVLDLNIAVVQEAARPTPEVSGPQSAPKGGAVSGAFNAVRDFFFSPQPCAPSNVSFGCRYPFPEPL
jgi:hypothetical protein